MNGRTDGRMNHISTKVLKRLRFQISVPAELEKSWIAVFFSLTSSFQTSCSSSNWQICKMTPPDPKTSEPPGRSFNNWIIFVLASLQSHPRLPLLLLLLLPVNKLHWHETLTLPSPSFDANDYLSPPHLPSRSILLFRRNTISQQSPAGDVLICVCDANGFHSSGARKQPMLECRPLILAAWARGDTSGRL